MTLAGSKLVVPHASDCLDGTSLILVSMKLDLVGTNLTPAWVSLDLTVLVWARGDDCLMLAGTNSL